MCEDFSLVCSGPVAVVPVQGPHWLVEVSSGRAGRPWHEGLVLGAAGSGVQFWVQPGVGVVNFGASCLAFRLGVVARWDFLSGPVLVCGSAGDDYRPEQAPPLVLMLLDSQVER